MKDVKHLFQPVPVWVVMAVVVVAVAGYIFVYANALTLIREANEIPVSAGTQPVEVETYNPQETIDGFNLQKAQ